MKISVEFVSQVADVAAFEALLLDYYEEVLQVAYAAGLPPQEPAALVQSSIDHLDEMLPPQGRLALAHDDSGQLVGCGTLRRIGSDAVEMKRLYVRPAARRTGLGKQLFEMRIDEARKMGARVIYADTARGNRAMLDMYERFGFEYVDRYPGNANPESFAPHLVFLAYRIPAPPGA